MYFCARPNMFIFILKIVFHTKKKMKICVQCCAVFDNFPKTQPKAFLVEYNGFHKGGDCLILLSYEKYGTYFY